MKKKNDFTMLMGSFQTYKAGDAFRVEKCSCTQDAVEIYSIAENGIFEIGKENGGILYSKTYFFTDINYDTLSTAEQQDLIMQYCKSLNAINTRFMITINNRAKDMERFRKEVLIPEENDGFDNMRILINEMIEKRITEGKQGIEQERYLTVVCKRANYEDAKSFFNMLERGLRKNFAALGSFIVPLQAAERLKILYEGNNPYYEDEFHFNFDECIERKTDFRNYIVASSMDWKPEYISLNDKFAASLYVQTLPGQLEDKFWRKIMDLSFKMMCSVHVNPVQKEVAVKVLNSKYLGIEETIRKQQSKRNKQRDFSSEISYNVQMEKEDVKGYIEEVRNYDEDVFLMGISFLVFAGSQKELQSNIESLISTAKQEGVYISVNTLKQRQGFNTVLPIGVRQDEHMQSVLTRSLPSFLPFNVQELYVRGGNVYGSNQLSKEILMGNRKKLLNGNGWYLGASGSGKSGDAKLEIAQNFLRTKDDIIIIDPQNEFSDNIVKKFRGTSVKFSPLEKIFINPFDVPDDMPRNEICDSKRDFILSICEQMKKAPLSAGETAVIGRCLKIVYGNMILNIPDKNGNVLPPTFLDFRQALLEQPEKEAQDLALYMEEFETGSLTMFAEQSNVDIHNRVISYGLNGIGKHMWAVAMVIMMENINLRVRNNFKRGIATWIYVDEAHELLQDELTMLYLVQFFKEIRKFGGLLTGILQNVGNITHGRLSRDMLSNSEFVVLLKQSKQDMEELMDVLGVTEEQLKYVTNADYGKGLLKHGNVMVPFDFEIEKGTELYELIDTNPHDK